MGPENGQMSRCPCTTSSRTAEANIRPEPAMPHQRVRPGPTNIEIPQNGRRKWHPRHGRRRDRLRSNARRRFWWSHKGRHGANVVILVNKGGARITKHRTSRREHEFGHARCTADRSLRGGAHATFPKLGWATHRADMHIRRKMLHAIEDSSRRRRRRPPHLRHQLWKGTPKCSGRRDDRPENHPDHAPRALPFESRYGVRPDVARSPCKQNSHTGTGRR